MKNLTSLEYRTFIELSKWLVKVNGFSNISVIRMHLKQTIFTPENLDYFLNHYSNEGLIAVEPVFGTAVLTSEGEKIFKDSAVTLS
jgi:hypothetical protein